MPRRPGSSYGTQRPKKSAQPMKITMIRKKTWRTAVGHGLCRIFGFSCSNCNGFNTRIVRGTVDKDTGNTTETVGKGARVVPVAEAKGGIALDTTGRVDDGKEEVSKETNNLDEGKPELSLTKGFNTPAFGKHQMQTIRSGTSPTEEQHQTSKTTRNPERCIRWQGRLPR